MAKKPVVSIVIPVYNGANFLASAVDSALAQTYENVEVIVVNDGSTDGGETEAVALSYGDRIRYFKKENGGVSSALNLGISVMQGEYFSWLSHDDVYTERKVECQIERISDGDVVVVCSERQINASGDVISSDEDYSELAARGIISWQNQIQRVIGERLFSGCALLIPKQALVDAGGFDETLRYNQDYDVWIKICLAGWQWAYVDEVGVLSRVHDRQVTQTRRDLFFTDSYALGKRLIPELERVSTRQFNCLFTYAKNCAKYNLRPNVQLCKEQAKKKRLFGIADRIKLFMTGVYGVARPFIRKVYYRLVKRVKTK